MVRLFGHYIPRALFLLLALEFVVLFLSVHLASEIRLPDLNTHPELFKQFNFKAAIFSLIHIVVMIAVGLYRRNHRGSFTLIISVSYTHLTLPTICSV